jgi:hypothetical protein
LADADFGAAVAEWDRTAAVLAMLANTVRDPKRKSDPYSPADFHPIRDNAKPAQEPATAAELDGLRKVLESCQKPAR